MAYIACFNSGLKVRITGNDHIKAIRGAISGPRVMNKGYIISSQGIPQIILNLSSIDIFIHESLVADKSEIINGPVEEPGEPDKPIVKDKEPEKKYVEDKDVPRVAPAASFRKKTKKGSKK